MNDNLGKVQGNQSFVSWLVFIYTLQDKNKQGIIFLQPGQNVIIAGPELLNSWI